MRASIPYKVIQRTLEIISDQGTNGLVNMSDVTEYLVECEKRAKVNLGYSREINPKTNSGQINLAFLGERGIIFLRETDGKYLARISELGRGLSVTTNLRLDDNIEEVMEEYPFSVHLRRKEMHSVSKEPGEVVKLDDYR